MARYNNKKEMAVKGSKQEVYAETHSLSMGPIPSAAEFLQYKEVMPDLPERIVKQFEADSEHIREMQRNSQQADIQYDKVCLWLAFLVMMSGIVGTMFLAYIDKDIAAVATAIGTVALIFKGLFVKK